MPEIPDWHPPVGSGGEAKNTHLWGQGGGWGPRGGQLQPGAHPALGGRKVEVGAAQQATGGVGGGGGVGLQGETGLTAGVSTHCRQ